MPVVPRLLRSAVLVGSATLVLAGCSGGSDATETVEITLTPRAVAGITLDVLGENAQRSSAVAVTDGVGAELVFRGAGSYTGDRLKVTVRPSRDGEQDEDLCAEVRGTVSGCEQLSLEKPTRLWLTWSTETPGTDPGSALLTRMRGGETSTIEVTGPVITGDPRTVLAGDRFTVASLQKVLEDSRLDLVTSDDAEMVAERVASWQDANAPSTPPPSAATQ